MNEKTFETKLYSRNFNKEINILSVSLSWKILGTILEMDGRTSKNRPENKKTHGDALGERKLMATHRKTICVKKRMWKSIVDTSIRRLEDYIKKCKVRLIIK